MKSFMRTISLFIIILSMLFCSCNKEEYELTNESYTTDKNIIDLLSNAPNGKGIDLTSEIYKDTQDAINLSFDTYGDGGNKLTNEIPVVNKNIIDLVTRSYDKAQLLEIINFNGSMNELNEQYPIECLKECGGIYRASYLGDCCIAVILFDINGEIIISKIYNAQLLKSDFDMIVKGKSLEEVVAIDPKGEYLFLYTGRNDTPRTSSHCTKDGYLITIEYNDRNSIIRISKELV